MKSNIIWSVVVVIVAFGAFFGGKIVSSQPQLAGALGNNYIERYVSPILYNGGYNSQLPVFTSSALGTGGDMTVGGGSLIVTPSNTASSTVVATCYQFYATSTETAQKFQASTTPGVMYSQYGTCPNL